MRLGVRIRQMMESQLKENFKETDTFFILRYFKVKAPDLSILRENLRNAGSKFFVTRNVLLKRILWGDNLTKNLANSVSGNIAVIFVKDTLISAKVLADFMKDHTGLEFKGGRMSERILNLDDFKILSKLPSLDFLKAKILFQMKSPIISFANTLKGVLNRFILVLKNIKGKESTI